MTPSPSLEVEAVFQKTREIRAQGKQAREESCLERSESQQSIWAVKDTVASNRKERTALRTKIQEQWATPWD
ncbi:hypothetical protein Q0M94_28170 (plasmid) [Deinococcus radiomollis]|uniref:hypothetical protein n=1 Tax=Deinococcus radiomollis TaxID=468916 RepID=UPI0038926216